MLRSLAIARFGKPPQMNIARGENAVCDRHRLVEQFQRLEQPIFCYGIIGRKRAQIEIVGRNGHAPRG
jgi:hypothetical protein